MADTARIQQGRQIERSERERTWSGSEPTHLDLFSGIGGFALAAQWAGFQTVAFCEIDKYCQKVLAKNFLAQPYSTGSGSSHQNALHEGRSAGEDRGESVSKNAVGGNGSAIADVRPASPILHSDIFDFDGIVYRGCDLLTGGFPCQPFSVAGKRRGAADDRHLWPEMLRVIKEARPAWVLGENVPGIIAMELDNVLSDLEGIGYATRPFVIPACAVDARHRRDRLWIVCRDRELSDTQATGLEGRDINGIQPKCEIGSRKICGRLADSGGNGWREEIEGWRSEGRTALGGNGEGESAGVEWLAEPDVGRVAHGIPSRVDRLKGLGNSIVPQVAYEILREIRRMI